MNRDTLLAAAAPLLLLFVSAPAFGLHCDHGIVSEGDLKIEVLQACGEPVLREETEEERAVQTYDPRMKRSFERRTVCRLEEWTYNFGPDRLIHFVRFEDGRVTDVLSDGYGYRFELLDEGSPARECRGPSPRRGDRKIHVLARCGEPTLKDVRDEERTLRSVNPRGGRFVEVRTNRTIEEWTYNFGPHRLLLLVRFENGRVVETETGGYGFLSEGS